MLPSPLEGEGRISTRGTSVINSGEGWWLSHDTILDIGQPINVIPHLLRDLKDKIRSRNKSGMTVVNCHPELCKANQRGTSCVSLHPSAKPLGVSGSCSRDDVTQPRHRISKFAKLSKKFNPRPQGVGVHPVSEAHSKELNVLTSYRLNDFKKKAAFTLAEVLITLAIIGVVAAMTIPTLVSNIQEAHFHAKWKECYSILNNAFRMTVAENPRMVIALPGSHYYVTKEYIDAILSHLHVMDTCGQERYDSNPCDNYDNYSWEDIKYKWSGIGSYSTRSRYKTLSGGYLNDYDFRNRAALLKNGAAIYFGGSHSGSAIVVDVNNYNNGPNVLGKDLYAINLGVKSNPVYIEELTFVPYGAAGSRCVDDDAPCSLVEPEGGFGVRGCSEDIGSSDANYIVEAAGAGCSYKYLNEK